MENPFIPWKPYPKQAMFLTVPSHEVFYGGAARGGKSCALLAAALQYVDRPEYAALLMRRTFADLAKPGALMDLAHQWLQGSGAEWNNSEHKWTFPSGATISFGYLETEIDKYHYQSAAYQFIGFDELSQFAESQYAYLFSRLTRIAGSDLPIRMRAASNPGGVGHEWVKKRFIDPYQRIDEHRFFGCDNLRRMFIPARLEDNPGVDQQAYEESLRELDPVTRAQLRLGDWQIQPSGNLFKRSWFEIVDAAPVEGLRTRAWDLAATAGGGDYLVGTKMLRTREGLYYIEHVVRGQYGPADVERVVLGTTQADGRKVRVRGEQEPAASGKIVAANWVRILAGFDVKFEPSSGPKITRWRPFSAQAEAGNVKLIRGEWNQGWLDRMELVPQPGVPDDEPDSTSCAFNDLAMSRRLRAPGDYGFS